MECENIKGGEVAFENLCSVKKGYLTGQIDKQKEGVKSYNIEIRTKRKLNLNIMKKCPIIKKEDRLPLCINLGLHVAAITLMATALHKLCRIHKGLRDLRKG